MAKYDYNVKYDDEKGDWYIEKFGLAAKFYRKQLAETIKKIEKEIKEHSTNCEIKKKINEATRKGSKKLSDWIDNLREEEFKIIIQYVKNVEEEEIFGNAKKEAEKDLETLTEQLKDIDKLCQSKKK